MKTQDPMSLARHAVELARKQGAQEAAAISSRSREVTVQWRDGKLDRISEATTRSLMVQLYVDGRYSSGATNDVRPEALERFIADAIAMTRALAADEHRRLPDPELYQGRSDADLVIHDAKQAALTPDERRRFARELEQGARAADENGVILSVTSQFADSSDEYHRVASNGFEGSHRGTSFTTYAEVSVKDADGRRPEEYDYAYTRWLADVPAAAELGRRSAERALARLGSTKGPSAVLPMVVDNRAAGRMVYMLLQPLSGQAVQQKRSFLDGKNGTKIGSDLLDVTDDPFVARGAGSRLFDSEGIAARRMAVFSKGKLENFYIDSYYGRKLGVRPTTGGASNLSWRLGDKTKDRLVGALDDAIFVNGFLGGNANAATGDFSLGVQGFRIRKGKLAEPIAEMNIAGNQLELWKQLMAVGNDPFPYSPLRTPTLVFDKVQFAGV
jgi:PmbA protein